MDQHYLQSSFRESLIEHLFIGEMLKLSWQNRDCALEVAKPEVDNSGYDIILEDSRVIRHLQLKTSKRGGSTARQKIHVSLGNKPSGCVLWIYFDEHTLDLGPFLYFGGPPGSPLPAMDEFKIAKHTKANADGIKSERPAHRVVPKGKFAVLDSIVNVYEALFGEIPQTANLDSKN
jgi:hypothetical protein